MALIRGLKRIHVPRLLARGFKSVSFPPIHLPYACSTIRYDEKQSSHHGKINPSLTLLGEPVESAKQLKDFSDATNFTYFGTSNAKTQKYDTKRGILLYRGMCMRQFNKAFGMTPVRRVNLSDEKIVNATCMEHAHANVGNGFSTSDRRFIAAKFAAIYLPLGNTGIALFNRHLFPANRVHMPPPGTTHPGEMERIILSHIPPAALVAWQERRGIFSIGGPVYNELYIDPDKPSLHPSFMSKTYPAYFEQVDNLMYEIQEKGMSQVRFQAYCNLQRNLYKEYGLTDQGIEALIENIAENVETYVANKSLEKPAVKVANQTGTLFAGSVSLTTQHTTVNSSSQVKPKT